MPSDPKRLTDGFTDLSGGMDSGRSPSLASEANPGGLQRNQVTFAVNATMRGGKIKPRPGMRQIALNVSGVTGYSGLFQGGTVYDPGSGSVLVASIAGKLFQYDVNSGIVSDASVANDLNSPTVPQAWFQQAENYLIVQDGSSAAIIYNGAVSVRAGAAQNMVPTGTLMAYCMGRLCVVLPDGYSYRVGDLVFGPSGTAAFGYRDAVLYFTENSYFNEGGDLTARVFGTSNDLGPITALRPIAQSDNSLGQGPLQVFTAFGAFSANLPFDRTTWKNLANPLQVVSLISNGATSQDSTQPVNSDLFFRASDGIRTFITARRNFGQWSNLPISKEMNRVLLYDNLDLLKYSSAVNFDNRLLITCSPSRSDYGTYHRGLVALDFDLISSMNQKANPAYDGVWTGPKILKILKGRFGGVDRCFIFSLEDNNTVGLWELTTGDTSDNEGTPINWYFETPAYPFASPFTLKRLDTGDMWINNLHGTCNFVLKYRPDRYPVWQSWQSWAECATTGLCSPAGATCMTFTPPNQPQFRPRMTFVRPAETTDPTTSRFMGDGYEFQARLEISGYCEIPMMRLHAFERNEIAYGPVLPTSATCITLPVCPGADFLT